MTDRPPYSPVGQDRHKTLTQELADMERDDPAVAAAAASYAETADRLVSGAMDRAHPVPCADATCEWHGAHPRLSAPSAQSCACCGQPVGTRAPYCDTCHLQGCP